MTQFQNASKSGRAAAVAATAALGLLLLAGTAEARGKGAAKVDAQTRAAVLQEVVDCRTIADSAQRLACYDGAVGKMDQAEKSGDIVVVDRDQVREAKKAAFGFEMPHFTFFERGEKPEQVDNVSAIAAEAHINRDGKWVVTLEDGASWVQVDTETVYHPPHKGTKVEIRKAAMGSFFMNLDGQHAIRAHRVN